MIDRKARSKAVLEDKTSGCDFIVRFNRRVAGLSITSGIVTIEVEGWEPIRFKPADRLVVEAILALKQQGAVWPPMPQSAEPDRGARDVSYYLSRFARGGLLEWAVTRPDGSDRIVIESRAKRYEPQRTAPPAQAELHLSRFASLRREDGHLFIESGALPVRAWLYGTDATAWLADESAGVPLQPNDPVVRALWLAGFVEDTGRAESEARRSWEYHDALFHSASRVVSDNEDFGGTYRFQGTFASPPAVKPDMEGDRIALPHPDPARILQNSHPLDQVMTERASKRDYGERPIGIAALGELLYRVARTKEVLKGDPQDLLSRPYPAGGSINELEFYLAVNRCEGLAKGFYHYDGHAHAVVRLSGDEAPLRRMLCRSAAAMGQPDCPPDVLIVLSARLPRMAWKYRGMAYRATLAHVGVVYQTLYLVATDMNLAGCANGTGDHQAFAEATGLDSWEETAVGEFALGLPDNADSAIS